MVVLLWLESRLSGESRSSGTSATDRPEGERDADERGQGDGGKIARDDRGRAEADGDLPEVEQGVGDQPQRRGGPEADAALRPQHAGDERDAEKELNDADVADEVLIEEAGIGHARDQLRSGENTSELQSLMRSSYAVFC